MAELLQYKCPGCGGAVEFDSTVQRMKCPYCESEFDIEALSQPDNEPAQDRIEWESQSQNWSVDETTGMAVYVCQSCGGEVVADKNTGATSCPYCGNHVIMKGQFEGDLKPDIIIPFKLDKIAAKEALKQHISGKKLIPKVFSDENQIDDIKGIYVPYWLFDCTACGEAVYSGEKVRTWNDNKLMYTETSYYKISRSGSMDFSSLPVDGSSKMDDALMESIEPFDISEGVEFNAAFLSGYLADKYDITSEQSTERANQRIKQTVASALRDTVSGYDAVKGEKVSLQLKDGKFRYALYPVWILNTTWNGNDYIFAMNGQTGKIVGDLPLDKSAFWKYTGIITAAVGAALYLIMTALGLL